MGFLVMLEFNELLNPDWVTSSCTGGIVVVSNIIKLVSGSGSDTAETSVDSVDVVDAADGVEVFGNTKALGLLVIFEFNELLKPGCSDWLTSSCTDRIVVVSAILTSISGSGSGTAGTSVDSVEGVVGVVGLDGLDGIDVGDAAGTSMGGPPGTSTGGPTGTSDSPTGTGPNGPGA